MSEVSGLGQSLEDVVAELIRSGRYDSRDAVLREGVRLVEEKEARLARLDAAIAKGIQDAEEGRLSEPAAVKSRLVLKYQSVRGA